MALGGALLVSATFFRSGFIRINQRDQISNIPEPFRHASGHRRADPIEALMLTAEVVIHEVQRYAVSVVLDLLGKRIGQAGEAADRHAHGQIVALDVAGRDMGGVGLALDAALAGSDASGRAVPLLAVLRVAGWNGYLGHKEQVSPFMSAFCFGDELPQDSHAFAAHMNSGVCTAMQESELSWNENRNARESQYFDYSGRGYQYTCIEFDG